MSEQMTTIKVPKSLRQRIAREAERDGSTLAVLLSRLLDDHDRQARFETVTDRGWPHHVRVEGSGLTRPGFAMTEQPRTVARERTGRRAGAATSATLREVDRWLSDFLGLAVPN